MDARARRRRPVWSNGEKKIIIIRKKKFLATAFQSATERRRRVGEPGAAKQSKGATALFVRGSLVHVRSPFDVPTRNPLQTTPGGEPYTYYNVKMYYVRAHSNIFIYFLRTHMHEHTHTMCIGGIRKPRLRVLYHYYNVRGSGYCYNIYMTIRGVF